MSIALYRYLCQHIVGSEDHVKQIRLMNAVRDNLHSDKKETIITSGSFGEGLDMRGSDLDIMTVSRTIEVYDNIKPFFSPSITYFSMKKEDVKPGFTQLKLNYSSQQSLLKQCEEQNGKHYLSSTLYKQRKINESSDCLTKSLPMIHGPCISDPEGSSDLAFCLHCNTWVSPAHQWITRSNNSWPSYNVKQCIIKHGVLFVPIGVKGSPKEDLEWRVSFSVGEKFLINTFTHTQLLCYALLKIILKDVIATFSECEDLLCSYFLKTIVFWISEEVPQSLHCQRRVQQIPRTCLFIILVPLITIATHPSQPLPQSGSDSIHQPLPLLPRLPAVNIQMPRPAAEAVDLGNLTAQKTVNPTKSNC
ncbi:uncharacterized protein [Mytilus edulis]|uniref:uncharacterized protein n=1 Tax=Mytilus edulis TaxID=6550 RepID=UPI0039F10266